VTAQDEQYEIKGKDAEGTELDERRFLNRYFAPPLTDDERKVADLEGWILGIM